MVQGKTLISGQLQVGDAELPTYGKDDVLARIDAAHKLAGLRRLLYCPSRNADIDAAVLRHCRKRGVEVYLWYKILHDNAILPEENEQLVDAFGNTGPGEAGAWKPVFDSAEMHFLACPANRNYNRLVLNRCRQLLKEYDGLFIDSLGFALPSFGLETLFACFCPSCLEREPRLEKWRKRIYELRDCIVSANDEEVERWGTFAGLAREFGLRQFFDHRARLITGLAGEYASLARELGKGFGIDVVSPALARLAGHDLEKLAKLADWIKPRVYCHTFGPSSIPLEYYCLAIGAKSWAKRVQIPTLMEFIGRSIDLEMPANMHSLNQTSLSPAAAEREIGKAVAAAGENRIFPGLECCLHPDYETGLNEETIADYLEAAKNAPGVVLSWNLLFIPDVFLNMIGKTLH